MDYFDILLAKKLNGGGGGDIDLQTLNVTENGTVNAPSGVAYNKVITNVPAPSNALFKQTLSNLTSPIATFTGADAPIDSLKASIVGVQSGSGDPSPSNIRPISGWSSCEVTRTGKNLINPSSWKQGLLSSSDGKTQNSSSYWVYTEDYIKAIPNESITLSLNVNNRSLIYIYDKDMNFTRTTQVAVGDSAKSATLSENEGYVRFALNIAGAQEAITPSTASNYEPQAELSSTATTYEAYNGNTYTILFKDSSDNPLTVYYGYIDISKGKMFVTHIGEFYDGSSDEGWEKRGNPNQYFRITVAEAGTYVDASIKSNQFEYANVTNNNTDIGITVATVSTKQVIGARPSNYLELSLEDWKTMLASNPLQVIYELVTPLEYDLTPLAIRTDGVTNLYVNCGEVTELKYYSETP